MKEGFHPVVSRSLEGVGDLLDQLGIRYLEVKYYGSKTRIRVTSPFTPMHVKILARRLRVKLSEVYFHPFFTDGGKRYGVEIWFGCTLQDWADAARAES